ncbi:trichothecene biosynthesis acetyltransferase [Talaromyces proteolyticus]|uniref:Trichothecene biosynthesis acetyltransferase n=1 Tax=Talaromyces proteolyticus TaxID=1131652 RepID=A0AAD4KJ64_9EURO|nr:trichothecene biosynthesis acetyltransferase [Talaromyces proteolyticus]KAH8689528.1 trichothecene biosynthesis acetyltransferase [Talaromyces proteolyticus]
MLYFAPNSNQDSPNPVQVDKEKEWQDLNRYQDVFGQLPMLQAYSHIILTFSMPQNVSQEEIIKDIENAMRKVEEKVPWMAAQIVNVGKAPGYSGVNKYAPCPPAERPVVVKDVSDAFPTYAEVKRLKAPINMLDSAFLSPCSSFPQPFHGSEEDPARVIRLQVSFINGGIFLNFVLHHATGDAGGHFWLARMIAMAMRGEEFPESFLEEANRDRRKLFPLLGPDEPMLDHSHLLRPPITADNPIVTPTTTTWHFFRLTAAKMAKLKDLASQKEGFEPGVPYITTDDAISAFCWQRFITARLPRLDLNTVAKFSRTIDGRKSLGISSNYLGDVIHNVQTHVSVKDLTEKPLSTIASRMRKRLNEVSNAYHVRSFASFIMSQPDKSTITYGGRVNTETDIGSSSVRAAELYFDFGKLGRPDFVRRPCLKGVSCPGLLAFLPQNPDGDCDFIAALTEADVAVLNKDPVWTSYVEYIG